MYFPEEIVVSYNADLLQKQNEMDDDDDGKGGYVTFNLAWSHQQKGYVNASYVAHAHSYSHHELAEHVHSCACTRAHTDPRALAH